MNIFKKTLAVALSAVTLGGTIATQIKASPIQDGPEIFAYDRTFSNYLGASWPNEGKCEAWSYHKWLGGYTKYWGSARYLHNRATHVAHMGRKCDDWWTTGPEAPKEWWAHVSTHEYYSQTEWDWSGTPV